MTQTYTETDVSRVRAAVNYIRAHDCDFLTAESVGMYAHVSTEATREIMLADGFAPELVA